MHFDYKEIERVLKIINTAFLLIIILAFLQFCNIFRVLELKFKRNGYIFLWESTWEEYDESVNFTTMLFFVNQLIVDSDKKLLLTVVNWVIKMQYYCILGS